LKPSELFQLTCPSELGSLGEEWLDLAASLDNTSYFQTPDWVLSWWNTVGGQPFTLVVTWRGESGQLEAIALLSRVGERIDRRVKLTVPVWANTGSGPGGADHCGWLARSNRIADVRDWLLRQSFGGTLLFRNLDPEVSTHIEGVARQVHRTTCPRMHILSEDSETGRSANFREQLRAKGRKLRRAGVTMRWVDPSDMDDRVLEALIVLHQARWDAKGASSNFTPQQIDLHRRLIKQSGAGRGPAAVIAEHREQVIGVLYGFWWKDVFTYYQLGWNPDWASYSLGTLLLQEGIKMAKCKGARVFDFLRGNEPFKYRFGAHDRIDTTWIIPRGLPGTMLTFAFSARNLLRSILKRG
jgi:CelD/BcsL family acetyltransferase involved in cellulose biosynthesis